MGRRHSCPDTGHRQAEVVIVGYGGAGAAAAITAHDAGAAVLVLEKAPRGQAATPGSPARVTSTRRPPSLFLHISSAHTLYETPGKT
jgi:glycine/D-amino acid oxidase-like deaminating enzyme